MSGQAMESGIGALEILMKKGVKESVLKNHDIGALVTHLGLILNRHVNTPANTIWRRMGGVLPGRPLEDGTNIVTLPAPIQQLIYAMQLHITSVYPTSTLYIPPFGRPLIFFSFNPIFNIRYL
jgi:hypothetical protein